MKAARRAGHPVTLQPASTLADGIAVKRAGDLTFEHLQRYLDDVVTVSEEEIAAAILYCLEKEKTVAEGAGAVAVAALHAPPGRAGGRAAGGLDRLGRQHRRQHHRPHHRARPGPARPPGAHLHRAPRQARPAHRHLRDHRRLPRQRRRGPPHPGLRLEARRHHAPAHPGDPRAGARRGDPGRAPRTPATRWSGWAGRPPAAPSARRRQPGQHLVERAAGRRRAGPRRGRPRAPPAAGWCRAARWAAGWPCTKKPRRRSPAAAASARASLPSTTGKMGEATRRDVEAARQ